MQRIRHQRVAEQMKKEVADIIRNDVKDPRIGFATVTRVEVAGDLQHAKVFVSVLGSKESGEQTLAALQKAAGFIRGETSRRLRMRVTPEMVFKLDSSGEYSAHIDEVIRSLKTDAGISRQDTTGQKD